MNENLAAERNRAIAEVERLTQKVIDLTTENERLRVANKQRGADLADALAAATTYCAILDAITDEPVDLVGKRVGRQTASNLESHLAAAEATLRRLRHS